MLAALGWPKTVSVVRKARIGRTEQRVTQPGRAERAKEAAQQKERERRQRAVAKAQSALDAARRKHEKNAADIQAQIEALEERSRAEIAHWEKEKARLEAALRRARGG